MYNCSTSIWLDKLNLSFNLRIGQKFVYGTEVVQMFVEGIWPILFIEM